MFILFVIFFICFIIGEFNVSLGKFLLKKRFYKVKGREFLEDFVILSGCFYFVDNVFYRGIVGGYDGNFFM